MEQLSIARSRNRDQDFPTDTNEYDRIFYQRYNNETFKTRLQHVSYKVNINLIFLKSFNFHLVLIFNNVKNIQFILNYQRRAENR